MKRELTCIVCPMGCAVTVELKDGQVLSVCGNTCKRGEVYARSECTHPTRTLTTTVRCEGGGVVSVKSSAPIPKDKLFVCMDIINHTTAVLPVSRGSAIIENIDGLGVDIIATQNRE